MTPLLGGQHWRLTSPAGPVHVWVPKPGGQGAVVLYVHGYGTDVDGAWENHRLPEQFRDGKTNATFIAIEAPSGKGQSVRWPDLSALLSFVRDQTGLPLKGPVTAIGHSGAFATVARWLKDARLAHVVLLDALYGQVAAFAAWAKDQAHKLTNVVTTSGPPRRNSESALLPALADAVTKDGLPSDGFSADERRARVLHVVAHSNHGSLARGAAIAKVLARAPVRRPGRVSSAAAGGARPSPKAGLWLGLFAAGCGVLWWGSRPRNRT